MLPTIKDATDCLRIPNAHNVIIMYLVWAVDNFVETPRKFTIAKLSIHKLRLHQY